MAATADAGDATSSSSALRGLRIGVPRGEYFADLDPHVEAVVQAALARLRHAGATLIEVEFGPLPTPHASSDAHHAPSQLLHAVDAVQSPSSTHPVAPSAPASSGPRTPTPPLLHPVAAAEGVIASILSYEAPRAIASFLYTHTAPPPPPSRALDDESAELDDDGNPLRRKPSPAGPVPLDSVLSVSAVLRSLSGPLPERALLLDQLDERTATSAAAYRAALVHRRPALKQIFAEYFSRHAVSAIVYPTTPLAAQQVRGSGGGGSSHALVLHNGSLVDAEAVYMRNTRAASAAGLPCLTVPAGVTKPKAGALKKTTDAERLPVSLEFVMPAGADEALLALGRSFQKLQSLLPDPVVMARWGEGLTHFTSAP
jgi:hypothetical protein